MADIKLETPKTFGGFEALSDGLLKQPGGGDIQHPVVDPEDVKDDKTDDKVDDKVDDVVDDKIDDKVDDKVDDVVDDKIDDVVDDKVDDITDDDFKELEPQLTTLLRDELGKELGWEYGDEDKFESISDLVEYMKDVVEESSKPIYASDEIKTLNDFVADGGDLKNYFEKTSSGEVDFDSIDIDSELDQKRVIREHLRSRGLKENTIKTSLNRYEDSGILEEEAQSALELLKEYKTGEQEKLLKDQKKQANFAVEQQQNFFNDVKKEIEGLNDIRGLKLTKEKKQELLNYIFKPTADNRTAFQREYADNVVKNLIESAYFTKEGDAVVDNIKSKASSDAYKQIRDTLKTKKDKRNIGSKSQTGSGGSDSFSSLAKTLLS